MNGPWSIVSDGLGDGGGVVNHLLSTIQCLGVCVVPWTWGGGPGLLRGVDHGGGRRCYSDSEGVITLAGRAEGLGSLDGGCSSRGGSRSNGRGPGLDILHTSVASRARSALGDGDWLCVTAIGLWTTVLADWGTSVAWDGKRSDLVVWKNVLLANSLVDRSGGRNCTVLVEAAGGTSGCWGVAGQGGQVV